MTDVEVNVLIEKWSNQDSIKMTQDEYNELIEMDLVDQWDWLQSKYPSFFSFDVVNIDINKKGE